MKKTLIVLGLVILAASTRALATAQIPDNIVYEGKEHRLHSNPMEPYFRKHPDKRPRGEIRSTALWRGYVATFEIREKKLLLKDIKIEVANAKNPDEEAWKSVRQALAPADKDFPIDWFSGILVIPHGKLVNYVHMGYGSTYSDYILLEFKAGQLTGERKYDHKQYEEFRARQFEAYRKTPAYQERVAELKKDNFGSDAAIDSFLRSFIIEYTSEFLDEPGPPEKKEGAQGK